MTAANVLALAKGFIPLDAVTYDTGEAVGLDFTPSAVTTIPAGGRLRGGRIFGSYTLGAGARFDGYATDVTVDGPADVNAYVNTNVIHAKGAITAKPGYDCTVSEPGFVGTTIPTVTATHFRSGQAYAGAHQIRLFPLDDATLNSVRWVHPDPSVSAAKVNIVDDFVPGIQAQTAFRRGYATGPGAWDLFLNPDGTVRYQVGNDGKPDAPGYNARGPIVLQPQVYAEFKNTTRSFFAQAINTGDYWRVLIGFVGDGLRLFASGLMEVLGPVHANAWATPPAGGSPSVALKVAGIGWYVGTGDPTLTAAQGSKYTDVSVPRDWKMTSSGWVLA